MRNCSICMHFPIFFAEKTTKSYFFCIFLTIVSFFRVSLHNLSRYGYSKMLFEELLFIIFNVREGVLSHHLTLCCVDATNM